METVPEAVTLAESYARRGCDRMAWEALLRAVVRLHVRCATLEALALGEVRDGRGDALDRYLSGEPCRRGSVADLLGGAAELDLDEDELEELRRLGEPRGVDEDASS